MYKNELLLTILLVYQELTTLLLLPELVHLMRDYRASWRDMIWGRRVNEKLKEMLFKTDAMERMHFHSPPHFPFHKNRYIYSEFLWKVGLAEKDPCTDLLSSEPSLGIPSLFFLHEARRKNRKVTRNKRTLGSSSISSLHTYMAFPGGPPQKHRHTQTVENKLSLKAYLAWVPPILSFAKSGNNMNSCWKPSIMRSMNWIL